MTEKHAVKIVIDDDGVSVELLHLNDPCDQGKDSDGRCVLEDWVEEAGYELFGNELTFIAPVQVEWNPADEPRLRFGESES